MKAPMINNSVSGSVMSRPFARPQSPHISLIVPVYNEAETIPIFLETITPVMAGLPDEVSYEIIFINDGSRDNTQDIILQYSESYENVKLINLARNFGKESAMCAGLDYADSDAVIIMDVDLQDPPELIQEFYRLWMEGNDMVCGERISRKTDSIAKRWTAYGFYWLFNRLAYTKIPGNVGDYRLLDRRVLEAVNTLRERKRFTKGLFAWVGYKTAKVPYKRVERVAGKSKFNFKGLLMFGVEGLFSFSTAPLRYCVLVGLTTATLAVFYAIYLTVKTLIFGNPTPGYASLMVVSLLIGSINLFGLGVLSEYLIHVTHETKQRPIYIIEGIYQKT